jgi:hypothetical protein
MSKYEDEVALIQKSFEEDKTTETFNAIIMGDIGSGKTHLLRTARRPIFIDSFDPGGTKTLRDDPGYMKAGGILVDSRFEREDPKKPSVMKLWDKEFNRRRQEGFFNNIGTYVIDSATTWADAVMNFVLQSNNRAGGTPQQMDWMIQMNIIRDAMKVMCSLPCDCILTAHIDFDKDEATGRMMGGLMMTGKLKKKIPLLFDEIYLATAKDSAKGTVYSLQTRPSTMFPGIRTRLGTNNRFEQYEVPDIKALLKKADRNCADQQEVAE